MPYLEEGIINSDKEIYKLISMFMGCSLDKLYRSYAGESLSSGAELGSLWRVVIKHSVIEEHHLRFDERVHLAEDMLFAVEALRYSRSCQIVHKCIYEYCIRRDSATHGWHKYMDLINNKKSLFQAREKLSNRFPELKEMYEGSAVLSSVQVAMWAASPKFGDCIALKDFCEQPYVKESYKKQNYQDHHLSIKYPFSCLSTNFTL